MRSARDESDDAEQSEDAGAEHDERRRRPEHERDRGGGDEADERSRVAEERHAERVHRRSDETDADRNEGAIERADPRRACQALPVARDDDLEEQRRDEERDERDDGTRRTGGVEAHQHEEQDARTGSRLAERVRGEELPLRHRRVVIDELVLKLSEHRRDATEADRPDDEEVEGEISEDWS